MRLAKKVVKRIGRNKITFIKGWTVLKKKDGSLVKVNIKDFHRMKTEFEEAQRRRAGASK